MTSDRQNYNYSFAFIHAFLKFLKDNTAIPTRGKTVTSYYLLGYYIALIYLSQPNTHLNKVSPKPSF